MNSEKRGGGTRNYAKAPSTLAKRKSEYDRLMATGDYDPALSHFDKSGGYVLVHKHHNPRKEEDREDLAGTALASKGYKVILGDERSTVSHDSKNDGSLYDTPIDFKTITTAGNYTIKSAMEKAAKQGAKTAVIIQQTPEMNRSYVESQIELFKTTSPRKCVSKLENVIVVGMNGTVHRRKL